MNLPKTTGQAAHLLQTTEPRLADLVRKGKISPEPVIVAGRRLWTADQVRQAARHMGALTPEIDKAVSLAFQEQTEVLRG
jgi:hypothetical protein